MERTEIQDMHDGKGKALVCRFFEGRTDESRWFFEIVFEQGAYAGYHRHEGNEDRESERETFHLSACSRLTQKKREGEPRLLRSMERPRRSPCGIFGAASIEL